MYSLLNPNAVLMTVRKVLNTPALMGDGSLIILLKDKRMVDLELLDREFRRIFDRGIFDVVEEVKIIKL